MVCFDYKAPTELFASRKRLPRRQPLGYKRFAQAADAIRFAMEEVPPFDYDVMVVNTGASDDLYVSSIHMGESDALAEGAAAHHSNGKSVAPFSERTLIAPAIGVFRARNRVSTGSPRVSAGRSPGFTKSSSAVNWR